jgi:DNA-binding LacI/PurR family transcriptional regulator
MREPWAGLRPVAGVVLGAIDDADAAQLAAAGIPLVGSFFSATDRSGAANVPQTLVGWMQTEHLAATGHTVIGYAAPDDSRVGDFFYPRLDGVRIACLELGLDEPVVVPVHLAVASAEDAVAEWVAKGVTGVACYNDETAFAVLAGMHRLGLVAPADLAVIGVDNISLAALASPPLTTIDLNIDRVAAHLAGLVVHTILGASKPRPLPSDVVTLVIRESA